MFFSFLSQFSFLLAASHVQILNLHVCVEFSMSPKKKKLLLWPIPLLLFPMLRSKPPSFGSSSDLWSGAETVAQICSCSVCLYVAQGGTEFGKTPIKPGGLGGIHFWGGGRRCVDSKNSQTTPTTTSTTPNTPTTGRR